jgi:novel protein kinase C epsilon type
VELEQAKIAKVNPNKYWDSKIDCEEGNEILFIRNQEVEKELETIKTSSCHPRRGRQCGIDKADDGKVSLGNFQFIRKIGEGAFGTVAFAKGRLLGGPEQLYAIKALMQRTITSSNICGIMAEKEALTLTSGHPFITNLYCCFQNKHHIFFVMKFMSGGDLKKQLNEVEIFSENRTKFYAAEITLAVQFLHQRGILHRDLKLENVLVDSVAYFIADANQLYIAAESYK